MFNGWTQREHRTKTISLRTEAVSQFEIRLRKKQKEHLWCTLKCYKIFHVYFPGILKVTSDVNLSHDAIKLEVS